MTQDSEERLKPLGPSAIKRLAKTRGHQRQQEILDALTLLAKIAIYSVPAILAILYACVLIHKAWMGEWDSLQDTLRSMLVPVTTYLAGLLSKNGLLPNHIDE